MFVKLLLTNPLGVSINDLLKESKVNISLLFKQISGQTKGSKSK